MRLSFGRYIAYNSPIHRMDPRVKLFMLLSLMISIFFSTGFTGYAILGITIFSLFFLAKLPPRLLRALLKPILFMFIILLLINCFLVTDGYIGWHWGGKATATGPVAAGVKSWFAFSEKAIFNALYMACRIYLMILITTILTATTRPLDLTLALEDLLSPLKLVRFPVHILSTIISIALRMIPTLIEEAGRIMKAQASRGVDFKNGHFKDKIKSTTALIIPLLVSAFQKAEDLAYAMDARGYDPHAKRTRYRHYRIHFPDVLLFIFGVGIASIIIAQSLTMGQYETFYQVWHWDNNSNAWIFGKIKTGFLQIRIPHIDEFVLGW
ncbi:energy-coupling factor transporter transmembrane component T family protein [Spiroplasma phoeniceum]|uniref:ABC-type cobalt transport system permease protein n=1 Tax=Spiroplasma phoeniceum P40 TaxID=1276259 RepID=A0A345DNP9_9MOLU|nr:energy-coupling factor transporter transmembrane component T [Spiroplasma phoeniceum]AXF95837.1 ABC-type cobalt transport system permease protein [Spiroplasma phoeniceum P40]